MIIFKTPADSAKISSAPKQNGRKTKHVHKASFHNCPVNTLFAQIFSGIAWNG